MQQKRFEFKLLNNQREKLTFLDDNNVIKIIKIVFNVFYFN